jgi:hypothetical protein
VPTSRRAIVLGLTVLLALEARAASVSLAVPSQQVQDLIQLADGRLAVSGTLDEHGVVHVIDPAGKTRADIEVAVPGEGAVVPYQKGFVTWRRSAMTSEVRYVDLGQQVPRESVLYSSDDLDYLYLAAPPAGDSLYVAESPRRGGMRLIRFNSSGQMAWTRSYPDAPNGVTAVNDGVVFMQSVPVTAADRPRAVLIKLGLDGEVTWSSPATYGMGVPIVRFHSQKVVTVASAAADETIELVNYDSGTGRQISQFGFPGFAKLVGTADGLLVIHNYMYLPYIAMLSPAGSIRWWHRYTPDRSIGAAVTGTMTRAGQLVLLTQTPDQSRGMPDNKVVFMEAEGKELRDGLSDCTRRDPLPVMQAEKMLRARYGVAVSPDYGLIVPRSRKSECPHPTEDEYASVVAAIADEFVNRAQTRDPWRESVYVRVMASGRPMALLSYYLGMGPSDSPESQIVFDIRPDNAKAFATYVRETVFPHISRMQEARRRFQELTGQVLGAHAPQGEELPEPTEFFAQMERAAQVLETNVSAGGRHRWPRRLMVGAIVNPTQFGSYDEMKPLEVADQTLREMIQKAAERQR